ncbi:hypothetical protein RHGRI_026072 [Rhododendron griersonianum]|uniref:Uncharacterized protein n=1 Tax=Rhododendron griersonianum TaxID=479676 RepID=A0AAV6IWW2_9ERIC|nr:hypothetical protein RHGRI_026072 [Rhododendron griersonianum]
MSLAFFGNPIVNLPQGRPCLNPSTLSFNRHVYCPKVKHVEDEKWIVRPIRDALKVVAPTSDFHLKTVLFGTYDRCLDVGCMQCGYNKQRFWSSGFVESKVSNVGLQNARVGRVVTGGR